MSRAVDERDALLAELTAERDAIARLDHDRGERAERRDALVRALSGVHEDVRPSVRDLARAAGLSKPWITKIAREDD